MNKQNFEAINIDVEPTIYVKDKKYTLDEFNQIVDYLASDIELNENQQIVFEWLKDDFKEYGDPIIAIGDLGDEILPSRWETCLQATYEKLDTQQKWEVLAAFAEWGMKEVAE